MVDTTNRPRISAATARRRPVVAGRGGSSPVSFGSADAGTRVPSSQAGRRGAGMRRSARSTAPLGRNGCDTPNQVSTKASTSR